MGLNPKPFHMEIRRNTQMQEVLLEDDIFAKSEQEALDYLFAWAKLYYDSFHPEEGIVIVCTHNWTHATLYQGSLPVS